MLCPRSVVASYLFRSAKPAQAHRATIEGWIFGVHEHHEVCVFGKESHLTLRVATVGAVRSPDKLLIARRSAVSSARLDVFAPDYASSMARFQKRLDSVLPVFPADAEYLNPPQGACGSSVMR